MPARTLSGPRLIMNRVKSRNEIVGGLRRFAMKGGEIADFEP